MAVLRSCQQLGLCAQDQASQNPNTDAGGAHEALSLTEVLLAIDG